jgi:translation initiation factor IF-2
MALALYTMIKPIESSKNVIKIKMKSGDLLFVDTPNTPSFLSLRVRALILAYARRL